MKWSLYLICFGLFLLSFSFVFSAGCDILECKNDGVKTNEWRECAVVSTCVGRLMKPQVWGNNGANCAPNDWGQLKTNHICVAGTRSDVKDAGGAIISYGWNSFQYCGECKTTGNWDDNTCHVTNGASCRNGGICGSDAVCREENCMDFSDNDNNNLVDLQDPNCNLEPPNNRFSNQCLNNIHSSGGPSGDGVVNGVCCGQRSIRNPGFEFTLSSYDWSDGKISKSNNKAKSGSSSGLIVKNVGDPANVKTSYSHVIELSETSTLKNITFSGWVYIQPGTVFNPYSGGDIILYWDTTSSFTSPHANSVSTSAKNRWIYLEKTVTIQPGIKYLKIALQNSFGNADTQKVYFDDILVYGNGIDYNSKINDGVGDYLCSYNPSTSKYSWDIASANAYKFKRSGRSDVISNSAVWFYCSDNNIAGYSFNSDILFESVIPDYYPEAAETFNLDLFREPPSSIPALVTGLTNIYNQEDIERILAFAETSQASSSTVSVLTTAANSGGAFLFDLSPGVVQYSQLTPVIMRIRGLPLGYILKNATNFNILVSNGSNYASVKHSEEVAGTSGQIETTMILPALSSGTHSFKVPIFKSQTEADAVYEVNNSLNVTGVFTSSQEDIPVGRFTCNKQGGIKPGYNLTSSYWKILECCGPDYNFCKNSFQNDFSDVRISGGPTSLLKDYVSSSNKNGVLLVGCSLPTSLGGSTGISSNTTCAIYVPSRNSTLPITDWSNYDYLEFDIFFKRNSYLFISINSTTYGKVFDDFVLKYSTSGDSLDTWHHIRIPINNSLKVYDLSNIRLYAKTYDVIGPDSVNPVKVGTSNTNYGMVYAVDRFFLSNNQTRYCTTDFRDNFKNVGGWITDLDNTAETQFNGKDACNNVPSYHWTGTRCCGDDQGINGVNETYYDTEGGCWNGVYKSNNTIARTSLPG